MKALFAAHGIALIHRVVTTTAPAPSRFWSTGDSAAHVYADCVTMHECRNVKQLAEVIARLLPA
ncbi:hypothetical protein [Nocardia abscessus]|uniref:hypothetical protein n=1 Tax=Nocardia abscessus TaxID=120957 RepID=UPI002457A134|nr:hypothetical protein [Nocardia abscessus]